MSTPRNYALRVYARPGVADACLLLQERMGVDVVVLLHAMYVFGELGRVLDPEALASAEAKVRPWRERVILPLRTLRIYLKPGFEGLPSPAVRRAREKVKAAELSAEFAALASLAAWADGAAVGDDVAAQGESLLVNIVNMYSGATSSLQDRAPAVQQAIRALHEALIALRPVQRPQGAETGRNTRSGVR